MSEALRLQNVIEEAAAVAAARYGLNVWGVELAGGSGRPIARVFIEKPWLGLEPGSLTEDPGKPLQETGAAASEAPGGVTVDECAEISRLIGLSLDVEDIFSTAWILEVSSPGLDRTFYSPDQLPPYIGSKLDVALLDPHPDFPGRRRFTGTLKYAGGTEFDLSLDSPAETACRFDWDMVRKAKLIHIFPDTQRPGAHAKS
ncbi:MAG: hypothetical protein J5855_02950 [Mailhella sp.]|nr:hypothetical protein [Mailhella sp.]